MQWLFSFILTIFLILQPLALRAEEIIGVAVELSSAPERSVIPKGLLTSIFIVKNTGRSQDIYDLKALLPPGWNLVSSLNPIQLLQGESKTVTLTVLTPQAALTGVPFEISLIALSQKDPNVTSKASMKVNIFSHARIKVLGPQDSGQELKGIPGQDISYKFIVINLGNGFDKIQISAISAHGEKVDLSKDVLDLGVGGQEEVTATIHIPLDVSPGTKHVLFF